jgi:hypothetical protein
VKRVRHYSVNLILSLFVLLQLANIALMRTEPILQAAIDQYAPVQAHLVCVPSDDVYVSNPAIYAVIPSILTSADAPCEPIRNR